MQDCLTGHVLWTMEQYIKPPIDELAKFRIKTRKLYGSGSYLFCIIHSPDSIHTWSGTLISKVMEHIHAESAGDIIRDSSELQDPFYWPGHYNDVMM